MCTKIELVLKYLSETKSNLVFSAKFPRLHISGKDIMRVLCCTLSTVVIQAIFRLSMANDQERFFIKVTTGNLHISLFLWKNHLNLLFQNVRSTSSDLHHQSTITEKMPAFTSSQDVLAMSIENY